MAEAEALIDIRRLRSALTFYEKTHGEYPTEPTILYQLGALNYCHLGNGLEARRWFQSMPAGSAKAPRRRRPAFMEPER